MAAPLIQGASGSEGDAFTYASINENNEDIYTFTANEPVVWSLNGGYENLFVIDSETGKLSFKDSPDYETTFNLNGTTLEFETNYFSSTVGDKFFVELYDLNNQTNKSTPITSNNFIQYVNDGSYNQSIFHRLVSNFIIQGGGFQLSNDATSLKIVQSRGTILNEPINSRPKTSGIFIEIGCPNIAASASIPPTPQPKTDSAFTMVV